MLKRFVRLNQVVCGKVDPWLTRGHNQPYERYPEIVAEHVNAAHGQVVVDVGGGKTCWFADDIDPGRGTRLIALDCSREELKQNPAISTRVVCDASKALPLGDGEADIVTTRFLLEHLRNVETFIQETGRVLKPGGCAIHIFPSKFSPFAILNQLLPQSLSRALLRRFFPYSVGHCGFQCFYDHCYYSAFERLLTKHGFTADRILLGYNQSAYYHAFVPAYLLNVAYDSLLHALKSKNLCANMLIVARKDPR
jgi:ubiquinone/menaquinone biosynthesis C-methylase UbiE